MVKKVLKAILILSGLIVGVIVLHSDNPFIQKLIPPCFFHELTGLYCPGCGTTRAGRALLHFDLLTAIRNNVMFVITLPLLAVYMPLYIWDFIRGEKKVRNVRVNRHVMVVYIIVLFLFTILRNIPVYPFTLLAPIPKG